MNEQGESPPFNGNELMELLRGLERKKIPYQIEYRRTSGSCDGIAVRISWVSISGKSDSSITVISR
jgi:hypothetical protein